MTGPRERRRLLALFVLALLLRCAFSLAYGLGAPPERWGDDADYDAIASRLVFDHQYENSWFPPGYPFFLAIVYSLFGHSLAAVRLLQALLGAAACVVVYLIGRDTFGPAVGWFSGLALAAWPGHIYMSWRIMSETLFTLLIALSVYAARPLLAAATRGAAGGASTEADAGTDATPSGAVYRPVQLALVLGLALGAATLVKSNLLAFPALVIGCLLAGELRAKPRPPAAARRAAPAAAALAAFLLMLLANPLANRLSLAAESKSGPVALTPGNAGPTLWWSNNPLADGYFVDPDDTAVGRRFIARHGESQTIRNPNPFVRDAAQRRLALAWIRENPGDFLVLVLRKLWNAYGPTPHAAVLSQSPFAQLLQLITWGALLPAALAGIVLTRRRWRAALPLHLVLLASLFATVVFYGTPRFTLPVAPYLLVFAACSLCSAACQLRGMQRRPASPPHAVAAGPPRAAAAAPSSGAFPQPGNL